MECNYGRLIDEHVAPETSEVWGDRTPRKERHPKTINLSPEHDRIETNSMSETKGFLRGLDCHAARKECKDISTNLSDNGSDHGEYREMDMVHLAGLIVLEEKHQVD